jgi:hypothetical protein
VQHYRLYFLDGAGRFTHAHDFFAEGDERAVRIAEGWREGRGMELWQQHRKVRRWESE